MPSENRRRPTRAKRVRQIKRKKRVTKLWEKLDGGSRYHSERDYKNTMDENELQSRAAATGKTPARLIVESWGVQ